MEGKCNEQDIVWRPWGKQIFKDCLSYSSLYLKCVISSVQKPFLSSSLLSLFKDCVQLNQYKLKDEIGKVQLN